MRVPIPRGDLSSHVFREVRSKRLVVVDEDGFERVVAGFLGAHVGFLEVNGKSDSPDGHHQIALIV